MVSPIGGYDRADDINPSAGLWSFIPYWAATLLLTPNTQVSVRLRYLHNFQNSNPAGGAPVSGR